MLGTVCAGNTNYTNTQAQFTVIHCPLCKGSWEVLQIGLIGQIVSTNWPFVEAFTFEVSLTDVTILGWKSNLNDTLIALCKQDWYVCLLRAVKLYEVYCEVWFDLHNILESNGEATALTQHICTAVIVVN